MSDSNLKSAVLPSYDYFGFGSKAMWLAVGLLILSPLVFILSSWFGEWPALWNHLIATTIKDQAITTILLLAGTGVGVLILGTSLAWLQTMVEYPGQRFFEFALLLPLAIPSYIFAFVYFNGSALPIIDSSYLGIDLPEMPTLYGLMLIQSFAFYSYVYLLARAGFMEQSMRVLEAGRTLGASPATAFWRLALPLSRPFIVAGLALALMESLNDLGSMLLLGVNTVTIGIYRVWNGYGDVVVATQMAGILLMLALAFLWVELWARKRARFSHVRSAYRPIARYRLNLFWRWFCTLYSAFVFVVAFVLPVLTLCYWALSAEFGQIDTNLIDPLINTLTIAAIAATIIFVLGLWLTYIQRARAKMWQGYFNKLFSLGYAVPGVVLAIGIYAVFSNAELAVSHFFPAHGLLLSSSVAALIFAYGVRFMGFGINSIDAGFTRIPVSYDEAARMLGTSGFRLFKSIHMPLLSGSLFAGLLLVFVEVMKELPTTLLLRPFNFDTLAVRTFFLASDERIEDAAMPALALVCCGVFAVGLLNRLLLHSFKMEQHGERA